MRRPTLLRPPRGPRAMQRAGRAYEFKWRTTDKRVATDKGQSELKSSRKRSIMLYKTIRITNNITIGLVCVNLFLKFRPRQSADIRARTSPAPRIVHKTVPPTGMHTI